MSRSLNQGFQAVTQSIAETHMRTQAPPTHSPGRFPVLKPLILNWKMGEIISNDSTATATALSYRVILSFTIQPQSRTNRDDK